MIGKAARRALVVWLIHDDLPIVANVHITNDTEFGFEVGDMPYFTMKNVQGSHRYGIAFGPTRKDFPGQSYEIITDGVAK